MIIIYLFASNTLNNIGKERFKNAKCEENIWYKNNKKLLI